MTENNNQKSFNSEKQDLMKAYPCQLKDLKLSCYGCCGDDWSSKEDIENDIWLNSNDFKEIYTEGNKSEEDLKTFKDRFAADEVSESGVCMNLVDFGEGCLACPLHKFVNSIVPKEKTTAPKQDLRVGHCDTDFECETVKFWGFMPLSQREEFVEFLKSKKFNNYDYSMKNVSGELIKEFLLRNEIVD